MARCVSASRAKLTMLNTVSKIRGQVKNPGYPQSEGLLGECMIRHGKELGGESNFGEGLGLGRVAWVGSQCEAWRTKASALAGRRTLASRAPESLLVLASGPVNPTVAPMA